MMLILILLILHFYFPYTHYNSVDISPDFLLLVIIGSLRYNGLKIILISFVIGIYKDFITQSYFLGFLTFVNTILGYIIQNLRSTIYKNAYYTFFSILIFFYFFTNYFLQYSESYFFYFKFSLIKTLTTIFALFLFNLLFPKNFKKDAK